MQVRREAFEPAHRLSILVRPHGYIMGAVAHVDPCGSGMQHIQPRVLRSQLPRQLVKRNVMPTLGELALTVNTAGSVVVTNLG